MIMDSTILVIMDQKLKLHKWINCRRMVSGSKIIMSNRYAHRHEVNSCPENIKFTQARVKYILYESYSMTHTDFMIDSPPKPLAGLQHQLIWRGMPSGLPDDTELLPEALRNCGYRTFGVGKWHLGYAKSSQTPWGRGFEKFTGYLGRFSHVSQRLVLSKLYFQEIFPKKV